SREPAGTCTDLCTHSFNRPSESCPTATPCTLPGSGRNGSCQAVQLAPGSFDAFQLLSRRSSPAMTHNCMRPSASCPTATSLPKDSGPGFGRKGFCHANQPESGSPEIVQVLASWLKAPVSGCVPITHNCMRPSGECPAAMP